MYVSNMDMNMESERQELVSLLCNWWDFTKKLNLTFYVNMPLYVTTDIISNHILFLVHQTTCLFPFAEQME